MSTSTSANNRKRSSCLAMSHSCSPSSSTTGQIGPSSPSSVVSCASSTEPLKSNGYMTLPNNSTDTSKRVSFDDSSETEVPQRHSSSRPHSVDLSSEEPLTESTTSNSTVLKLWNLKKWPWHNQGDNGNARQHRTGVISNGLLTGGKQSRMPGSSATDYNMNNNNNNNDTDETEAMLTV